MLQVVDIFTSIQETAKSTKKPDHISSSSRKHIISKLFEVRGSKYIIITNLELYSHLIHCTVKITF